MPDLKKTIQALECCLNRNYFSKCPAACPYNGTEQDGACGKKILDDALELLKEMDKQEGHDDEKDCNHCLRYDPIYGICFNEKSDYFVSLMHGYDCCDEWEEWNDDHE